MSEFTIRLGLREAAARLDRAGVSSPALTARALLEQASGQRREWLLAHGDEALDDEARARFEALLARAMAREPLAYVLGHREFFGLDFVVDSRVLIPRAETELLVELALGDLRRVTDSPQERPDCVLDVGTGSGAIAVAIAKNAPGVRVVACDVSEAALEVARQNAARLGASNVEFRVSDLLAGCADVSPTVVVANLPYVTRAEIDGLPPEIQAHEPRVALDGGDDGLDLVRQLMCQLAELRRTSSSPRAAFFEIGASQGPAALAAALATFPNARATLKQDLARLDRALALCFESN